MKMVHQGKLSLLLVLSRKLEFAMMNTQKSQIQARTLSEPFNDYYTLLIFCRRGLIPAGGCAGGVLLEINCDLWAA